MKFTFSWLKSHLQTSASPQEIADTLTCLGIEVESAHNPATHLNGIVSAKIVTADRHPNAERLQVCQVDTGTQVLEVVCGAPNARAGLITAFIAPGTVLPTSGEPLRAASIRGVQSHGMLCSAQELNLQNDESKDGILELAADTPLGSPIADVLGLNDPLFEVAVTPNRPDCLSVRGIARDLMAAGLGTLQQRLYPTISTALACAIPVTIAHDALTACPFFVGRIIEGVKNGPSPAWLQKKLLSIGVRPLSALVDITNYVLFDVGQPMHVFDADQLDGPLQVSFAQEGETLNALNGKTYTLDDTMAVIRDGSEVRSLAGIMGGETSGCTEKTTRVFIESAYFNPLSITLTGRKLQLISDSRFRFERGVDHARVLKAMNMATQLILEHCGGTASNLVTAGHEPKPIKSDGAIRFSREHIYTYSGIDVPSAPLFLEKLGFRFEEHPTLPAWKFHDLTNKSPEVISKLFEEDVITVSPPSWRHDIHIEQDVIEEVLRLNGYDKIPSVPLPNPHCQSTQPTDLSLKAQARHILAMRGLHEAMTWSFISPAAAALFQGNQPDLTLRNPISAELAVMRPSLLPNLIEASQRNWDRSQERIGFFEVGTQFSSSLISGQHLVASGLRSGLSQDIHWSRPTSNTDIYDVKGDVLETLHTLGIHPNALRITTDLIPSWYHPGQSARVMGANNKTLAYFGAIHPTTLEKLNHEKPCFGFEIFLDALPQLLATVPAQQGARSRLEMWSLLPVFRDFSFLAEEKVLAESILKAVKKTDRLISEAMVFDVYQGRGINPGHKSISVRVTLQPRDKTLTEPEISAICDRIVQNVTTSCGAILRS